MEQTFGPTRRAWKKPFLLAFGIWTLVFAVASLARYGTGGLIYTLATAVVLVIGLKISELLIAVMTRIAKASPTAIALLFFLKIAWWASLFLLARHVESRFSGAIAFGVCGFLLAIVSAGIWLGGIPKISFSDKADS